MTKTETADFTGFSAFRAPCPSPKTLRRPVLAIACSAIAAFLTSAAPTNLHADTPPASSGLEMHQPLGLSRQYAPKNNRTPSIEERRAAETQKYRKFWTTMNEDWGRANVDGKILSVFDVRRRVSTLIDSVRSEAMMTARNEVAAIAKANPANWDIWRVPAAPGERNRFPFALRARRVEAAPPEIQQQFLRQFEAEREQRRAATPDAPDQQILGESLVAAREKVATAHNVSPEKWEIALADGGSGHVLRSVEWEILPQVIQDEFRFRTEKNFETTTRLNIERSVLKDITDNLLLAREARERGVNITASMLTNRVEDAIRREPDSDRSAFYARLEAQGVSLRQERRDMEEDMVTGYMRAEIVRPVGVEKDVARARVSPQRIQEHYEKVKASRYTEPAHYRYRQLWLTPTASDETAATIQAQSQYVQTEVKNGKPFADLVKLSMNKDAGRNLDGGSALWYEAGKLNERLRVILEKLPDGGVSEPMDFSTPGGRPSIYFVQRVECRPGAVSRLEDVQDEIADEIVAAERQSLLADFLDRLGGPNGKFFIRYYDNRE